MCECHLLKATDEANDSLNKIASCGCCKKMTSWGWISSKRKKALLNDQRSCREMSWRISIHLLHFGVNVQCNVYPLIHIWMILMSWTKIIWCTKTIAHFLLCYCWRRCEGGRLRKVVANFNRDVIVKQPQGWACTLPQSALWSYTSFSEWSMVLVI